MSGSLMKDNRMFASASMIGHHHHHHHHHLAQQHLRYRGSCDNLLDQQYQTIGRHPHQNNQSHQQHHIYHRISAQQQQTYQQHPNQPEKLQHSPKCGAHSDEMGDRSFGCPTSGRIAVDLTRKFSEYRLRDEVSKIDQCQGSTLANVGMMVKLEDQYNVYGELISPLSSVSSKLQLTSANLVSGSSFENLHHQQQGQQMQQQLQQQQQLHQQLQLRTQCSTVPSFPF